MVELAVHDLIDLPDVVAPLRGQAERFVLYVDDFSVANNDPALTALKTALDGGIEEPPENVLIYATSNRRHLMPESKSDNRSEEHTSELQSLMRISYAVFCLQKKNTQK